MKLKTATETLAIVDAFFEIFNHEPLPVPDFHKECEINGKRVSFDYTSSGELSELIEFYDNAVYIGSGYRTWYNGVLNEWDELRHFFVSKKQDAPQCICEGCLEIVASITWAKDDELLCDSCSMGQRPDLEQNPTSEQSALLTKQRNEFNQWRERSGN